MPTRKKTAKAQVPLRMPEPLRAKLEKAAKNRGVSMNAEAIARLEQSFVNSDDLRELVMEMFGGKRGLHFALQMAAARQVAEQIVGDSIENSPDAVAVMRRLTDTIFDRYSTDENLANQVLKQSARERDPLRQRGEALLRDYFAPLEPAEKKAS